MMGNQGHQVPVTQESRAGPPLHGASREVVRNLVLVTIGVLLMAAWDAYNGFKHPESSSSHFLHAVLWSLFAVYVVVRRKRQGGPALLEPTRRANWAAVLFPVYVVLAFGFAQLEEARHHVAREKLETKKQAWRQAVQRQRDLTHLALEQSRTASAKWDEAYKVWIGTSQKVQLPDGTPGFRTTPEATRTLEEAKEEEKRASERWNTESQRLFQLEAQAYQYR